MIEKKRIKELIKKKSTIYCSTYTSSIDNIQTEEIKLNNKMNIYQDVLQVGNSGYESYMYFLEELFEDKDDSEFYVKYQFIERTEKLRLPFWKEFLDEYCLSSKCFRFDSYNHHRIWLYYTDRKDKEIKIKDIDGIITYLFDKPLTKENYLKACEICRRLFIGEEIE